MLKFVISNEFLFGYDIFIIRIKSIGRIEGFIKESRNFFFQKIVIYAKTMHYFVLTKYS